MESSPVSNQPIETANPIDNEYAAFASNMAPLEDQKPASNNNKKGKSKQVSQDEPFQFIGYSAPVEES